MIGVPGTLGEHWTQPRAAHPSPARLVSARRSPEVRAQVDVQWARWAGLPEDEVEGFVAECRRVDLVLSIVRERELAREAVLARLDRDLAEFWLEQPAPPRQMRRLARVWPQRAS